MLGKNQFTIQLSPMLELDLAGVVVSGGEFYQCLLGMDILGGKPGILGPATVTVSAPGALGSV